MKKTAVTCCVFMIVFTVSAFAQAPNYGQLDPKPYDPEVDPNIDFFMSSWKEALPHHTYGSLIERDIFSRCEGDPLHPRKRGAILTNLKGFSHGSLQAGNTTQSATLEDEQRIFYVYSGEGIVTTGPKTEKLYDGIAVLVPPGVEFAIENTSDRSLDMYILTENLPDDFKPRKDILVRDENVLPFSSSNVHWCHCYKNMIGKDDGLATLRGMGPVWFNPMTMGQPHSHAEGVEEIWFSLNGDITILIGKQLRAFPPGTAYKIPPNGATPHSTINVSDEPVKVFWFMN